jgi:hypothetical protein
MSDKSFYDQLIECLGAKESDKFDDAVIKQLADYADGKVPVPPSAMHNYNASSYHGGDAASFAVFVAPGGHSIPDGNEVAHGGNGKPYPGDSYAGIPIKEHPLVPKGKSVFAGGVIYLPIDKGDEITIIGGGGSGKGGDSFLGGGGGAGHSGKSKGVPMKITNDEIQKLLVHTHQLHSDGKLPEAKYNFATGLCQSLKNNLSYGKPHTHKQIGAFHSLWNQIVAAKVPPEKVLADFSVLAIMFANASKKMKYPCIKFETEPLGCVALKPAGQNSKNYGKVYVTNGDKYPNDLLYGMIDQDGIFMPSTKAQPDKLQQVVDFLKKFNDSPEEVAASYGKHHMKCCFCNSPLSTKESLQAGYGPVCAKNYGLAWGGVGGTITGSFDIEVNKPHSYGIALNKPEAGWKPLHKPSHKSPSVYAYDGPESAPKPDYMPLGPHVEAKAEPGPLKKPEPEKQVKQKPVEKIIRSDDILF